MLTLHTALKQSQASEQLVDLQHYRLKFNSSTLFKCLTRRQTCFNAAAVMLQHSRCSRCNRKIKITSNILMFGSWTRTGSELVLPPGVCWHKLSHHRHEAQKKQKVPPSSVISYLQQPAEDARGQKEEPDVSVRTPPTRREMFNSDVFSLFGLRSPPNRSSLTARVPLEECSSVTRRGSHVKVRQAYRDKVPRRGNIYIYLIYPVNLMGSVFVQRAYEPENICISFMMYE